MAFLQSCSSIKQTPDAKVTHVRFVERALGEPEGRTEAAAGTFPRESGVKSPKPKGDFPEQKKTNRSQLTLHQGQVSSFQGVCQ